MPAGLEVIRGVCFFVQVCIIVVLQQLWGLAQLLLVPIHGIMFQILRTAQSHWFSHPRKLVSWDLDDHGPHVTCRERKKT